jgi:hypothetical protein
MGFFSDLFSGHGSDIYNKFNKTGVAGPLNQYLAGTSWGQQMLDPLDLFGGQARGTQEEISNIMRGSAQAGIDSQRAMMDQVNALYEPYRSASLDRLPDYQSMTTGGQMDINASPMYQYETEQGTRAINRQMAARGLFDSTARGSALSDFLLQAGQNEAGRQYGRQLDTQQMGTDAIHAIGGAGRTAGANVSSTYGNLGQGLNANMQMYGQNRQNAMNQGAGALYGLSNYLQQR